MVNALVEEATGCDLLKTLHRAGLLPAERPDGNKASLPPFLQAYVAAYGNLPSTVSAAWFYREYDSWCHNRGFAGQQLSAGSLLTELKDLGGDGIYEEKIRLNAKLEKCLVFTLAAQERLRQKLNLSTPAPVSATPGAEVVS